MTFVDAWRRAKSAAFDLDTNSTARGAITVNLGGRAVQVYANANLSIYSGWACNARCHFCVEELRPASRGVELATQKSAEGDDGIYFARLGAAIDSLRSIDPSVSITGGEPSLDPRLPMILRTLEARRARRRTMTTNGTGLLQRQGGRRVIDWIIGTGVRHLNISRAHPAQRANAELMLLHDGLELDQLREVVACTRGTTTRVRLSCVLVVGAIDSLDGILRYLDFAAQLGVDNVIFRQLMKIDPASVARNHVVRFSDSRRVSLEPILDQISGDGRFEFRRQIVGYYYYVEVWRFQGMDVVFEEADLGQLEQTKRMVPNLIHEFVFHPNGRLASTWQPWDGVIEL